MITFLWHIFEIVAGNIKNNDKLIWILLVGCVITGFILDLIFLY
jgi:hypothetical protein